MLIDFYNSFTSRLVIQFALKSTLNIPPHLTNVATLSYEISEFIKCCALGLSEASCHVKTQPLENIVEKYLPNDVTITSFTDKKYILRGHTKNTITDCTKLP